MLYALPLRFPLSLQIHPHREFSRGLPRGLWPVTTCAHQRICVLPVSAWQMGYGSRCRTS